MPFRSSAKEFAGKTSPSLAAGNMPLRRFAAAWSRVAWGVAGLIGASICGCHRAPAAAELHPDLSNALQIRSDIESLDWE